jgi:hypothetical protein
MSTGNGCAEEWPHTTKAKPPHLLPLVSAIPQAPRMQNAVVDGARIALDGSARVGDEEQQAGAERGRRGDGGRSTSAVRMAHGLPTMK